MNRANVNLLAGYFFMSWAGALAIVSCLAAPEGLFADSGGTDCYFQCSTDPDVPSCVGNCCNDSNHCNGNASCDGTCCSEAFNGDPGASGSCCAAACGGNGTCINSCCSSACSGNPDPNCMSDCLIAAGSCPGSPCARLCKRGGDCEILKDCGPVSECACDALQNCENVCECKTGMCVCGNK